MERRSKVTRFPQWPFGNSTVEDSTKMADIGIWEQLLPISPDKEEEEAAPSTPATLLPREEPVS